MTTYKPFDPNYTFRRDDGKPGRYLSHPLDETYIERPGDFTAAGAIPPEDFEVRNALMLTNLSSKNAKAFGVKARSEAVANAQALIQLINRTPEHQAAFKRIINGTPVKVLNEASYQIIEEQLDRLEAPGRGPDGQLLKLHERVLGDFVDGGVQGG
jgi:hypothetical protein